MAKYLYGPYTPEEDKTTYSKVINADALSLKPDYPSIMKGKNWYWQKNVNEQSIIITTRTTDHPCLGVSVIKNVAYIPSII